MSSYKRKTDFANIDFAKLADAIQAVKKDNYALSSAAKKVGIPRNSLRRYLSKLDTKENIDFSAIEKEELIVSLQQTVSYKGLSVQKMIFTPVQETTPLQYIKKCADFYYGLTIKDLKKPSTKQESSADDVDFCIICLKNMPSTTTKSNSIACNECKREVHLKCVKMRGSAYTCAQCTSDNAD